MRRLVVALATTLAAALLAAGAVLLVTAQASGAPDRRGAAAVKAPQRPAPRVLPFATKLRSPKPRVREPRSKKVDVPPYIDGCDHSYGKSGQCVPWVFPKLEKGQTKCDWLRERKLAGITVNSKRDRHRLDPDRNGIACD